MAYTTPPNFINEAVLTAAQLNALSAAVAELQSAGEQPTAAWVQQTASSVTMWQAWMRHQHRYLWWRVDFSPASCERYLKVEVITSTGTVHQLFQKDTGTKLGSYAAASDLNGLLAAGEFYTVRVTIDFEGSGSKLGTWMYCQERSVAA